jgi:hypothetical protein
MRNERISLRTVATEDGAAILDTRSGQITTLNSTGAYIWQALEQGLSIPTIAARLARETGEDLSIVEQGVSSFLAELNGLHLQPC